MAILESNRNKKRQTELFEFTQGIEVDRRLLSQEIQVQRAWARGLCRLGFLKKTELAKIERLLKQAQLLEQQKKFKWRVQDEDVHMNLERFITEKAGILGRKMHFGRSRNDLIATTLRLFVRDTLLETASELKLLIQVLKKNAQRDMAVLVPGQTHLQSGQPIRLSFWWMSHAFALARDLERISQVAERTMQVMPSGAAALSGTSLRIDLNLIARELGFKETARNAYDSVSDRDFILEALSAFAILGVHLSRFAEDVIVWSSSLAGFFELPKDWSTGSSIMPNKRNPDVAELTRAKSSHLIGAVANGLTLMKGIPLSYNSDLHELKSVYLRSLDEANKILPVLSQFAGGLISKPERARDLLLQGHILATEYADQFALQGVPFRKAYQEVAGWVEEAERHGLQVHELGRGAKLTFEQAVEKRKNSGGTSRQSILTSIKRLDRSIKSL